MSGQKDISNADDNAEKKGTRLLWEGGGGRGHCSDPLAEAQTPGTKSVGTDHTITALKCLKLVCISSFEIQISKKDY